MDWLFAVLLDFIGPRKDAIQELWVNLEIHIGKFREEISQILERIQSVCLAGLNHAVGCSTGSGSLRGSAEQPVLPSYGEVPDGSFADIVGHGCFAMG